MKKATVDPTVSMVTSIYKLEIPLQSEISNPFKTVKRTRKNSLLAKKDSSISDDLNTWTAKTFVDYFSNLYFQNIGGVYKKTYTSDCSVINEIFEFMIANELDEKEWTKKFIDWSFVNQDLILKQSGTFLISTIKKSLNTFYQQSISVKKQSVAAVDIFDDLVKMVEKGKTKEILSVYGIPIIATYFVNHKNISTENIEAGMKKLFLTLMSGNNEEYSLLTRIVQRSINRSPYPDTFVLKDWRSKFPELISKYKNELWWRDQDYTGQPQYKYDKFVKLE